MSNYTGTKVADLSSWVSTLEPAIAFRKTEPCGPGTFDPALRFGRFDAHKARDLSTKLLENGWVGRRLHRTTSSGDKVDCIVYRPADIYDYYTFSPRITMDRPFNGVCSMRIHHMTYQSLQAKGQMLRLNKHNRR